MRKGNEVLGGRKLVAGNPSGAGRCLGPPREWGGRAQWPRALEEVGVGLREGRGLAVPSEPVVDVVQVSAQEYGERHEAELQRKETWSERSRVCRGEQRGGVMGGEENKAQRIGRGCVMGGVEKGVDKRWAGLERYLTLVVKNRVRDQSLGEVKSGGSGWVREPSCVYLKSRVLRSFIPEAHLSPPPSRPLIPPRPPPLCPSSRGQGPRAMGSLPCGALSPQLGQASAIPQPPHTLPLRPLLLSTPYARPGPGPRTVGIRDLRLGFPQGQPCHTHLRGKGRDIAANSRRLICQGGPMGAWEEGRERLLPACNQSGLTEARHVPFSDNVWTRDLGQDHLKETHAKTDAHYGDEVVVQPLLEAPLAALGMYGEVISPALTPLSGTALTSLVIGPSPPQASAFQILSFWLGLFFRPRPSKRPCPWYGLYPCSMALSCSPTLPAYPSYVLRVSLRGTTPLPAALCHPQSSPLSCGSCSKSYLSVDVAVCRDHANVCIVSRRGRRSYRRLRSRWSLMNYSRSRARGALPTRFSSGWGYGTSPEESSSRSSAAGRERVRGTATRGMQDDLGDQGTGSWWRVQGGVCGLRWGQDGQGILGEHEVCRDESRQGGEGLSDQGMESHLGQVPWEPVTTGQGVGVTQGPSLGLRGLGAGGLRHIGASCVIIWGSATTGLAGGGVGGLLEAEGRAASESQSWKRKPGGWGPHAPGTARSPSSPLPHFGSSSARRPSLSAPAERPRVRVDPDASPNRHLLQPTLATPCFRCGRGRGRRRQAHLDPLSGDEDSQGNLRGKQEQQGQIEPLPRMKGLSGLSLRMGCEPRRQRNSFRAPTQPRRARPMVRIPEMARALDQICKGMKDNPGGGERQ
ncbi:hypothetical protein Cadr_000012017 [Camelus dromedarius]|uniref:Uncharacterized protein n=1 Tax=Camelus dromedarius TaxID=9838 RepID=A0A5N4DRE0_CAMDR|nr:hypothetical protein Cadr_000012017 [Camelus dromedarius]